MMTFIDFALATVAIFIGVMCLVGIILAVYITFRVFKHFNIERKKDGENRGK
ncbi:MAG: hypothetical protein FWE33_04620 [Defluviitaleaceae bacterium]|nr:hypothetical protein [Defluviitaleaceae bacterium]